MAQVCGPQGVRRLNGSRRPLGNDERRFASTAAWAMPHLCYTLRLESVSQSISLHGTQLRQTGIRGVVSCRLSVPNQNQGIHRVKHAIKCRPMTPSKPITPSRGRAH